MNCLLTALLISAGWHIGKLVYIIIGDVIRNRLYETKWYSEIVLGVTDDSSKRSSKKKAPIGFYCGDTKNES